ncbi:MAG: glycosyltransferase [Candidatus Kapaibacterium sp.]
MIHKHKIAIIDSSDTWYAQPNFIRLELEKMGYEVLWLAQPNNEGYKNNQVPHGYISICIANNLSPIDIHTGKDMQLNHPPLERAYKSKADFVFVGDKTIYNRFFKDRMNAFYMPYAVDTKIFKPLDIEEEYDVGFIGNIRLQERIRRINLIKNHFKTYTGSNLYMNDANHYLNKCKIIFNTADGKEINMRVFEALAAKKLLVTEEVNHLNELFTDGEHLITYKNDNEIVDKISYYLNNNNLRNSIADNGYLQLIKNHTYANRAEFIVKKIDEYIENKMINPVQKLNVEPDQSKLNILLSNHHLLDFTGSEIYTYTIALQLKRLGHNVTVYSKYLGRISKEFTEQKIKIVDNLDFIKADKFDIAHVHHNINAAEVRKHFPNLPIIIIAHGVIPFLEQPSSMNLGISRYLAISPEVREHLIRRGIEDSQIFMFGNLIDSEIFYERKPVKANPKNALVISAKISARDEETIRNSCHEAGLNCKFIGGRFGEVNAYELAEMINEADIVFSLGRGVIEAILSKRAAIVLDSNGGDGMVTAENYMEISFNNFSGRRFKYKVSREFILNEISKYDAHDAEEVFRICYDQHSTKVLIPKLVNNYHDVIRKFNPDINSDLNINELDTYLETIDVTRTYSALAERRKSEASYDETVMLYNDLDKYTDKLINKYSVKRELPDIACNKYDIIIPVYNAREDVLKCIDSVIRHTSITHDIYILDDCSTDSVLINEFEKLEAAHRNIKLVKSDKNQGFIKNVNRGFTLSMNDVIILNSDTEVSKNWIEKLDRCSKYTVNCGIVSPLSNNATILSVPVMNISNAFDKTTDESADIIEEISLRLYPEIPTAVGFCMLIKRELLNKIGVFDTAFGLGYGEENDFCERALLKGYRIYCADDTYVHHSGEASFSQVENISNRKLANAELLAEKWPNYTKKIHDYCKRNPLRYIQDRFKNAIGVKSDKIKVLHVLHNNTSTGGTELHTRNISSLLSNDVDSTLLYPSMSPNLYTDFTEIKHKNYTELIFSKDLLPNNEYYNGIPSDLVNHWVEESFAMLLAGNSYDIIHFHNLINWSSLLLPIISKKFNIKVVLTFHDYFLLCNEYNLVLSKTSKICGKSKANHNDDECNYCLSAGRHLTSTKSPLPVNKYIEYRNTLAESLLKEVNIIVSPSEYVKSKVLNAYSNIDEEKIRVIKHGIVKSKKSADLPPNNTFTITFLGNAVSRKGIWVFLKAVELLNISEINYQVLGITNDDVKTIADSLNVKLLGGYNVTDLSEKLSGSSLVVIASTWEETFCMTALESLSAGVPVIATNAGAIPENIKADFNGRLFEVNDSLSLAREINTCYQNQNLVVNYRNNIKQQKIKSIGENAEDYKELYTELLEITENTAHSPVSIIIPLFNKSELTKNCLESLYRFTDKKLFEIILIDNDSTDNTREVVSIFEREYDNIIYIKNSRNLGYSRANNIGARIAKYDYILLLNNDTIIMRNWLKPMTDILDDDSKVAAVGAKLLYEDNTIQHAGVAIIKDLSIGDNLVARHIYSGFNKNAPEVNKIMEYQALTGACLLLRKSAYFDAGGLDEVYWNAYEDVDLCFKLREMGFKIVYQPKSTIYHLESQSGPERAKGVKDSIMRLHEKWLSKISTDFTITYDKKVIKEENIQIKSYVKSDDSLMQNTSDILRHASVIILTYNSSATIEKCLSSVKKHLRIGDEVIIVDNNSKDDSVSKIKKLIEGDERCMFIRNEKNLGYSAGINVGIRLSRNPLIVMLNPDTIVTNNWLDKLSNCFIDENIAAAGPLSNSVAGWQKIDLYVKEKFDFSNYDDISNYLSTINAGKYKETKLLIGFCLAVRKSFIDKFGGLDEQLFLGNDDLELCWRISVNGARMLIATDLFIYHLGQESFRNSDKNLTSRLVQESTDILYDKLEKYYGQGNVPDSMTLWGVDWFKPTKNSTKSISNSEQNNNPLVSIILLAKNQYEYTKECIDSIFKFTAVPFELILVDNGSSDYIPIYFENLKNRHKNIKLISNRENVGFPKGVNMALRVSVGQYVLIGNNDTIVTPKWLDDMIEHLEMSPDFGLAGPISNNISGPQLDRNADYNDIIGMLRYADKIKNENIGQKIEFPRLAFFCTLIKRKVFDKIGGLDERYSPGNYEDDDFCMRAQLAGFKSHILKYVFIHHYRSRSFAGDGNEAYKQRLETNQKKFIEKWGASPEEIWLQGKGIIPPELFIPYKSS